MPAAGELRELVIFQERCRKEDGGGGDAGTFADAFDAVHASYRVLNGGEEVMAGRMGGMRSVVITVRQSRNTLRVTAGWQVKDCRDGLVYAVKEPPKDPDGKRAWLEMLCQSGVAS